MHVYKLLMFLQVVDIFGFRFFLTYDCRKNKLTQYRRRMYPQLKSVKHSTENSKDTFHTTQNNICHVAGLDFVQK